MLFKLREGMTVLVESHYNEFASGLNFSFFTINKNKATIKNPNAKNLSNLYIWKRNAHNLSTISQTGKMYYEPVNSQERLSLLLLEPSHEPEQPSD